MSGAPAPTFPGERDPDPFNGWEPEEGLLNDVAETLAAYGPGGDADALGGHAAVAERLSEWAEGPTFAAYCAWLFLRADHPADRELAALLLKNAVRKTWGTAGDDRGGGGGEEEADASEDPVVGRCVRAAVVEGLFDGDRSVRRSARNVLGAIARRVYVKDWSQLIEVLVAGLSVDEPTAEAAMSALAILVEDMLDIDELDSEALGRPMDAMVPALLEFLGSESMSLRRHALRGMMAAQLSLPTALATRMEEYVEALSALAAAETNSINRVLVCKSISRLCDLHLEHLVPVLEGVFEFFGTESAREEDDGDIQADSEVRMCALEFWPVFVENAPAGIRKMLEPHLPHVLPMLVRGMMFTEEDLADLPVEDEDDSGVPDRPEDINPHRYKDDDSDDDGGEGDYGGDMGEHTVRKGAAEALDFLSRHFREVVLDILMPDLFERLSVEGDDMEAWLGREVAVLAIGCVAPTCMRGLQPHFDRLIPYFTSLLQDARPLVRTISAWTISRLSKWICVHARHANDPTLFFEPVLEALCESMHDHNKHAQETIASSLATFTEAGGELMAGYAKPVLSTAVGCLGYYQAKNEKLLWDIIGTMADQIGEAMDEPEIIEIVLPPLVQKWDMLADTDPAMLPLLECIGSVAKALGASFMEYAPGVFKRSNAIVENTLVGLQAARELNEEEPNLEFAVCALDMIGWLIGGLGDSFEPLLEESSLVELVCIALSADFDDSVRESAASVAGELCTHCFSALTPVIPQILGLLLGAILLPTEIAAAVASNASWAVGEIAMRSGEEFNEYAEAFVLKLAPIISDPEDCIAFRLLDNAAVALARIAVSAPEPVAEALVHTTLHPALFAALSQVDDGYEKESAYHGLINVCNVNPESVKPHFLQLCSCLASLQEPSDDIVDEVNTLLVGFRGLYSDEEWHINLSTIRQARRDYLIERFGLPTE